MTYFLYLGHLQADIHPPAAQPRSPPVAVAVCPCLCLCSLRAPGQRGAPSLGLLGLLGLLPPAPPALLTPGHAGFVSVRWEPPSPHRAEPSRAYLRGARRRPRCRRLPLPAPRPKGAASWAEQPGPAGPCLAVLGPAPWGGRGATPSPVPPRPEAGRSSGRGGLAGGGCGRRWPGLKGVRGALFRAMVPLFARCGDIWASLPCRGPGPLPHGSSVILQKTTQLFWELKRPNTQRVLRGGAQKLTGSAQERAVFKESGTVS